MSDLSTSPRCNVFTINRNPSVRDLHWFGLSMLVGLSGLGLLLWFSTGWKAGSYTAWHGSSAQVTAVCLWALGAILCLISFAAPRASRPLYVAWMTVTLPLGMAMSVVGLTLLFVFLLPFFSLIVRIGDPMRKKIKLGGTYWEDYKPHEATLERCRRPF